MDDDVLEDLISETVNVDAVENGVRDSDAFVMEERGDFELKCE